MKRRQAADTVRPEKLLELWMGDKSAGRGTRQAGRPPAAIWIGLAAVALLALVLVITYGLNALLTVVALVAFGVVLHVLGIRLAESELLSPGWFSIIVLAVALLSYAFLVPANSVAGLGRYMPRWVATTLQPSESRGWGPGSMAPGGTGEPTTIEPAITATPARSLSARRERSSLALTASAQTTMRGQPVTFMARLSGDLGSRGSVRFYDGMTALGTAEVVDEGETRIAYLTVTTLDAGQHEIRAELAGIPGAAQSDAVRHTVRGQ